MLCSILYLYHIFSSILSSVLLFQPFPASQTAKMSETTKMRKMARTHTCKRAGVFCRRFSGNHNCCVPACHNTAIQRLRMYKRHNYKVEYFQAVRNELHTTSQAGKSKCFTTVFVFGRVQNRMVNQQDTRT